jgi:hypothetical protein
MHSTIAMLVDLEAIEVEASTARPVRPFRT